MGEYWKISLGDALAFVGAVSVLSLFIVAPYTIGYFSYFSSGIMSFFGVIDYYQFSAIPLMVVVMFASLIFWYGSWRGSRSKDLSLRKRTIFDCDTERFCSLFGICALGHSVANLRCFADRLLR